MAGLFALLFFLVINLILVSLVIYGIVLSFQKAWYVGLAALVFPAFGLVVGLAKFVFKKDILK